MGKLIEKYSALLDGEESVSEKKAKKSATVADPLERFREMQKNNTVFSFVFDAASPEGNLFGKDEYDVEIVLEGEDLAKDLSYFSPQIKDKFINIDFNVKVKEIDEHSNRVFVRSAVSNRGTTRSKIIAEIRSELNEGKEPEVKGKIISVNEKRALVNICGQGILGICQIKHWSSGYIRTIKTIERGDIYSFLIVKPLPQGKHTTQAFELVRDKLDSDPWESIPDYIVKDSLINVECVEKPDGKSYWWGKCDKTPEIEIQCDYNNKLGRPLIGTMYKCKVKRLDKKAHKFTAAPFEIVQRNDGTKGALKMLEKKGAKKK